MDIFDIMNRNQIKEEAPLADRMRPQKLEEVVGQSQLLGKGRFLQRCVSARRIPSLILYGPPGSGKTTMARLLAAASDSTFFQLSAVMAGVKDIRTVVEEAEHLRKHAGKKSILFIDEIHRFSKNQQDALLPHVEKGLIVLVGATTENPYFEVNSALISRVTVLKLLPLKTSDIQVLLEKSLVDEERGLGRLSPEVAPEAMNFLAETAGGDARKALNALEIAALSTPANEQGKILVNLEDAKESIQKRAVRYDKNGDQHYDVISAFIKSIRGSDPDAALHYMAKMIAAGEDPEFIARRIIISASEDIGNADPMGMSVAMAAHYAVKHIGLPEARIPLAQAVTYLATAPKSNAAFLAINRAQADVEKRGTEVPQHLRDAHYRGAVSLGHGKDYKYAHNYPDHYVHQQYLPDSLLGAKYYEMTDQGEEKKRKAYMNKLHNQ
ncbi:replication-associated recombination protein A [Anoxynatronum buryatiense]|uniref:Replication-associated recombination protein A n=1 Tax=Anoxynatronum buryatiense TaxID=489973 RepID=A0AA45WUV7_9CLOT|nr:replication-associated recombination protein A [Anoxynatronum buryatiense]SMP49103.1 putative ATPase [Anoxynatronum buryatiense]